MTKPSQTPEPSSLSTEVPTVSVESRENLGSMLELDISGLDPKYNYRWVHKSPLKVARAKAKGYRFVDPENTDVKNVFGDSPETAADGTITVGDVVLMFSDKNLYKARKRKQRAKSEARLKGPERKFRKEAEQASQIRGERVEVITDKE